MKSFTEQPPYSPYGGGGPYGPPGSGPPPQAYPRPSPSPFAPQPGFNGPPGPPPPHTGYPPPTGAYNRPAPPPPVHPAAHGAAASYYGGHPAASSPQPPPGPPGPGPYGPPPPAGGPGFPPPPSAQTPYQHLPPRGPPSVPSPGYVPGQVAPGDYRLPADELRKAMKGMGTDEAALIRVLSKLDPFQVAAVRSTYRTHIGRDLHKDIKSETSGYFRQGLLAIIDGPLEHDASVVRDSVQGAGTKEWALNDVLLARSNADLEAIKAAYQHLFNRSLSRDVEDDLSFKTQTLFRGVLSATRHEPWYTPSPQDADAEARTIHDSTSARVINDAAEVCSIFSRASDNELRAINHAYKSRYHKDLDKLLEKSFSGHMKNALIWILHSATDPAMRDAEALEACMKGAGTKDEMLVVRVVRLHWNRDHLHQVKGAYRHRYGKELEQRVHGELSGDYRRLILALLQ